MKNKFLAGMIFSLFFLIILLNVNANAYDQVTVTGQANIVNNRTSQARDEALQDAFNKAIEKEIGTYLAKSTLVNNMQVVQNEIYSESKGYITNFSIIEEYEQENIYKIKIEAEVSKDLRNSLEKLGFILKTQTSNPRVLTLIKENIENVNEEEENQNSFSIINSQIHEQLSQIGFELVDKEIIQNIQENMNSKQVLEDEKEKVIELGNNYDADIIIYGEVFTENISQRDISSDTLHVFKAYGDIKAISTKNGRIIASLFETNKSYSSTPSVASNLALEKFSDSVIGKLSRKIIQKLNRNYDNTNLKLEILNINNFNTLNNIENSLGNIRGIESYNLRNFNNNEAHYDLKVSQSSKNIADKIYNIEEYYIRIEQIFSNRITIRITQ